MTLVRLIARPMLSSIFISGGIDAIRNADRLASRAKPVLDKVEPVVEAQTSSLPFDLNQKQIVQANGAIQVVAGALLATGHAPRLSSFALAASLVPTTLGGHRFWEETDPGVRSNQRLHFLKNVALVGGLLITSVDTAGKPSLAWHAKRQASLARKRAHDLTSS